MLASMKLDSTGLCRCCFLALAWLTCTVTILPGQNVYKDFVVDAGSQYDPLDYQQRGIVYQLQTGHFGLFGNCDDDRQKMLSPYIDWHCRSPQCKQPLGFVRDMANDLFRKSERLVAGAGSCVLGGCRCVEPEEEVEDVEGRKYFGANSQYRYIDPSRNSSSSVTDDQWLMESGERNVGNPSDGATYGELYKKTLGQTSTQIKRLVPKNWFGSASAKTNSTKKRYVEPDEVETLVVHSGRAEKRSRSVRSRMESEVGDFRRSTGTFSDIKKSGKSTSEEQFKLSSRTRSRSLDSDNFRISRVNDSKPGKDRAVDPRYFQFQRIGGSRNR